MNEFKNTTGDRSDLAKLIINNSAWEDLTVELRHVIGMAGHTSVAQDNISFSQLIKQYIARQGTLGKGRKEEEKRLKAERLKAQQDAIEKAQQDRLAEMERKRVLQLERDAKREVRRKKGELWQIEEDKREVIRKARRREQRAKERAEKEAAAAAELKAKEDAAAAVIKRREDGRAALHKMWDQHQAFHRKQCKVLAEESAKRRREEKKERCRLRAVEAKRVADLEAQEIERLNKSVEIKKASLRHL